MTARGGGGHRGQVLGMTTGDRGMKMCGMASHLRGPQLNYE